MTTNDIIKLCTAHKLRWTNHILLRLLQRGIQLDDVESALLSGEIIEHYPQDYPYPSCLVLGLTSSKQYLHVVCGLGDDELWLITAYSPDNQEWTDDFKTRKEI